MECEEYRVKHVHGISEIKSGPSPLGAGEVGCVKLADVFVEIGAQ
jgi:hypothetical protein